MNVALHRDGNFLAFPGGVKGRSPGRLRTVPPDVAGAHIGQGVDVVGGLVARDYFHLLAHIDRNDVRKVLASLLVDLHLLGRHLGGRGCTEPLGEIEDNVLQASAGTNRHVLQVGRSAGVILRAVGVFRHIDPLHVRGGAVKLHGSGDLARGGRGCVYLLPQDHDAKTDQ